MPFEHTRRTGVGDSFSDASSLSFVAGLPVVWIWRGGLELDPSGVLGLALPLVYLVGVGWRIHSARPEHRRAAWKTLALGMACGFPWLWGIFLLVIAPASAAWLCGWAWRRWRGRRSGRVELD